MTTLQDSFGLGQRYILRSSLGFNTCRPETCVNVSLSSHLKSLSVCYVVAIVPWCNNASCTYSSE